MWAHRLPLIVSLTVLFHFQLCVLLCVCVGYKQLQQELDATQKKLKSVLQLAEKAKLTHQQVLADTIEEMKRKNIAEWERFEAERAEKLRAEELASADSKKEEADRVSREMESTIQKRANEIVARTTAIYEAKFNEMRAELMLQQRTFDDLHEQHKSLLEWQKLALMNEANWTETRKSMEHEIELGKAAAKNLERYKTILKYMACHKFVKDVKLKQRLLPLHQGCSNLIALILKDDDLRERLINQQAELARWVVDAQAIEKSEGIVSDLPNTGVHQTSTANTSNRAFMLTNVDYLVASLIEVEHVLATCVATVLRYNQHHKTSCAGFFQRNSALTAHCMAVEKECRETKARANRTQTQLNSTLALLSRLEVKYSQMSRKLSKEDRLLAQRYLHRHGVTTSNPSEADMATPLTTTIDLTPHSWGPMKARESRLEARRSFFEEQNVAVTNLNPQSSTSSMASDTLLTLAAPRSSQPGSTDDLSLLSPRALHRKLFPLSPSALTVGTARKRTSSADIVSSSDAPMPTNSPNSVSGSPPTRTRARRLSTGNGVARSSIDLPDMNGGIIVNGEELSRASSHVRSQSQSRPLSSPSMTIQSDGKSSSQPQIPSATTASLAYSSSSYASVLNLATASPTQPITSMSRPNRSVATGGGNTVRRRPKRTPGKKVTVDAYESSSEDEFVVRPVSYTPPPSNAAIRAFDYEDGDSHVTIDGVRVEVPLVPTIVDALNQHQSGSTKAAATTPTKNQRRSRPKRRTKNDPTEEKENHDGPDLDRTSSKRASNASHASSDILLPIVVPSTTDSHTDPFDEKQPSPVPDSTTNKPARVTNSSLIPNATTTAWAHKLSAVQAERQLARQQLRHKEDEALPTQTSSKQRLTQPSPYQDPYTFGVDANSRSSSLSSFNEASHARTIPHPPPSLAKQSSTGANTNPPSSMSARIHRRTGPNGSVHPSSSSSSTHRRLRPSPPTSARPATSHQIHTPASATATTAIPAVTSSPSKNLNKRKTQPIMHVLNTPPPPPHQQQASGSHRPSTTAGRARSVSNKKSSSPSPPRSPASKRHTISAAKSVKAKPTAPTAAARSIQSNESDVNETDTRDGELPPPYQSPSPRSSSDQAHSTASTALSNLAPTVVAPPEPTSPATPTATASTPPAPGPTTVTAAPPIIAPAADPYDDAFDSSDEEQAVTPSIDEKGDIDEIAHASETAPPTAALHSPSAPAPAASATPVALISTAPFSEPIVPASSNPVEPRPSAAVEDDGDYGDEFETTESAPIPPPHAAPDSTTKQESPTIPIEQDVDEYQEEDFDAAPTTITECSPPIHDGTITDTPSPPSESAIADDNDDDDPYAVDDDFE